MSDDPKSLFAKYATQAPDTNFVIVYPRHGSVFPKELGPPQFDLGTNQGRVDLWFVELLFSDGSTEYDRFENVKWRVPENLWAAVRSHGVEQPVRFRFLGVRKDEPTRILSAGEMTLSVSSDPVDGALFYREVNLPFVDAVKDPTHIRWRFGSIGGNEPPPVVLEGLPVCSNCHSFSIDGEVLGMDIDYANDKGSYAIAPVAEEIVLEENKIITWSDYRRKDATPTFGLHSAVSPDGRYVVSTVKDRSVFIPRPDLAYSQLFFPVRGILAVYDRETDKFSALPGASDPEYVQSNASWSPDGKTIFFIRNKAYQSGFDGKGVLMTAAEVAPFAAQEKKFRYDIYRVPFNGGRGGEPQPLAGASGNGKSNYFPKFSPDGRWVVFCQADSYSLLQPDSKLYIVPAEGGTARLMNCNTGNMNSWHTFSPNGRWMVFASKQKSPYTQLYITHIDEEGNDTPAVLLENMVSPERAANIPEFVNADTSAIKAIREQYTYAGSYIRTGDTNDKFGDFAEAERYYRHALEKDPGDVEIYVKIANMLYQQRKGPEAIDLLKKALQLDKNSVGANILMGMVVSQSGNLAEGLRYTKKALTLNPENADVHFNLGAILFDLKRYDEAVIHFEEAFKLDSNRWLAKEALAKISLIDNRPADAVKHLQEALQVLPERDHLKDLLAAAERQLTQK